MTTQTVSPAPAPSAQVVGNAFVEQYYHILHQSPDLVLQFYHDTRVLSRPDPNGHMTTVTTVKSINDKICSLDYNSYKAEIKTADAQDSFKDGVIVLVTGCLTGKDNLRRKFTQSFFLAPQDKGYYVKNDIFRYVDESEADIGAGTVIGVDDTPSSSLTQGPEPVQVVDPPNSNTATSHMEEIEIMDDKANDQVIDERQTSNDRDTVVEAKSHSDENHISAIAEPDTSAFQDDAPKKSYASIVKSQKKKGPTKVCVPTNTARIAPVKTEKQSVNPATEALGSEASGLTALVDSPESKDFQEEVEGHSIYIRNLPLNATVAQLEAEFKKFGAIKQNGVHVRSNKQQGFCFGFVEFQVFSSMQNAMKASPLTIGDRQAAVEIKRTTTIVGSGRGHFTSSCGGFRNDNFRSRGMRSLLTEHTPPSDQKAGGNAKFENESNEVNFENIVVDEASRLCSSDVMAAECLPDDLDQFPNAAPTTASRKKLLVLDVNGLLAHIVKPAPKDCRGDVHILGRAIFKRPFCDDFLKFCFQNFDVGIWSSRTKKIIDVVVNYLLGDLKDKLLFCWDMSHSNQSGFKTLENTHKPLVCKELRKIWENDDPKFPWKKGDYDESNTLLLDDSPYKALLNPLHTAIFPPSYHYTDKEDDSIGPGGDLRVYLEGLLASGNVREYIERHAFGQSAINETNVSWEFYSRVLHAMSNKLRNDHPVPSQL